MLIEMWTDFAWPFCYIGKRRLEDALNQIGGEFEVVYRSFELDPTAERDSKENMYEHLARKYGMSIEQAKENTNQVIAMAKESGLNYQFDTLIMTNTFDAHRLTAFAKTKGLDGELKERILQAHFTESKHIGDHETLAELAEEVGLDRQEVTEVLKTDAFGDIVRADRNEATQLGINSVPFFVIDHKYAIQGAQPTEAFVQTIKQIQDGSINTGRPNNLL